MTKTKTDCNCADGACSADALSTAPASTGMRRYLLVGLLLAVVWYGIYRCLPMLSKWLAFTALRLDPVSHAGKSVEFFLYDTPKVLMLLTLVVFIVGIVRSFFTPQRTRAILAGRHESVGNVLAAMLGIVTPFCSCSAVPLFIGFVTAGVPLGVTFSFLIAAPLINEVALGLLLSEFGWRVALLYLGTGLAVAIVSGWILGRLKLERYVEDWVYKMPVGEAAEQAMDWPARFRYATDQVKDIVGKVWIYVLVGIAVGAGIHGYVPEQALASLMGRSAWWAVPVAVVIGVPMYANAAGFVPVLQAMLAKGAAMGTALAFMMSVIALSLPEAIILRKVLKPRLIAIFFGIVAGGILLVGYLFNAVLQ